MTRNRRPIARPGSGGRKPATVEYENCKRRDEDQRQARHQRNRTEGNVHHPGNPVEELPVDNAESGLVEERCGERSSTGSLPSSHAHLGRHHDRDSGEVQRSQSPAKPRSSTRTTSSHETNALVIGFARTNVLPSGWTRQPVPRCERVALQPAADLRTSVGIAHDERSRARPTTKPRRRHNRTAAAATAPRDGRQEEQPLRTSSSVRRNVREDQRSAPHGGDECDPRDDLTEAPEQDRLVQLGSDRRRPHGDTSVTSRPGLP